MWVNPAELKALAELACCSLHTVFWPSSMEAVGWYSSKSFLNIVIYSSYTIIHRRGVTLHIMEQLLQKATKKTFKYIKTLDLMPKSDYWFCVFILRESNTILHAEPLEGLKVLHKCKQLLLLNISENLEATMCTDEIPWKPHSKTWSYASLYFLVCFT